MTKPDRKPTKIKSLPEIDGPGIPYAVVSHDGRKLVVQIVAIDNDRTMLSARVSNRMHRSDLPPHGKVIYAMAKDVVRVWRSGDGGKQDHGSPVVRPVQADA